MNSVFIIVLGFPLGYHPHRLCCSPCLIYMLTPLFA